MISLYYWPTPNGHKVSIMLEETRLDYELCPVNILKGDQHFDSYKTINPNGRIPAIIDTDGPEGNPLTLFESGAILQYLAEKTGNFLPTGGEARYHVLKWLSFQIGNVGPMFGQCGHFLGYADEDVPYAKQRYYKETVRLYGVLDDHLRDHEYLAADYSIADMATFPWIMPLVRALHTIDIAEFPHVQRWHDSITERPAVKRGVSLLANEMKIGDPTEETREAMFGDSQYKRNNTPQRTPD
jgi:GST-like protein